MRFLTLIALLAFVSCQVEQAEDAIDIQAIKADIQAMEDAYATAQNNKDADAVVVYYADDAHSLGADEPTTIGKAAILARINEDFAQDSSGGTTRFELVDVYACGQIAVEVGRSITTMPDGTEQWGKYMSLFEKQEDGSYLCIRDIWNSDYDYDAVNEQ